MNGLFEAAFVETRANKNQHALVQRDQLHGRDRGLDAVAQPACFARHDKALAKCLAQDLEADGHRTVARVCAGTKLDGRIRDLAAMLLAGGLFEQRDDSGIGWVRRPCRHDAASCP